jgi:hypothetical protein
VPALAFANQEQRIQMVVRNALDGTTFIASRSEEDGRHLVIIGRRQDGRMAAVRFRAVREASATTGTAVGVPLRLAGVKGGGGGLLSLLLGWFIPAFRGVPRGAARVRIDAGGAKLDIVCEDAEWWENEPAPPGAQ